MTSAIAIVALLHALPILLTAYISRSKGSVQTAAVIMAITAFVGGAFQYVLVDLIVVFAAYVYAVDKWCMDDAPSRPHTLKPIKVASYEADLDDDFDPEDNQPDLDLDQVASAVISTVRTSAEEAGLDIRYALPDELASSMEFIGALLGLIVAYSRAAGYDDNISRVTILGAVVYAIFDGGAVIESLDVAESSIKDDELNQAMNAVSGQLPTINETGSFRHPDPTILTPYMQPLPKAESDLEARSNVAPTESDSMWDKYCKLVENNAESIYGPEIDREKFIEEQRHHKGKVISIYTREAIDKASDVETRSNLSPSETDNNWKYYCELEENIFVPKNAMDVDIAKFTIEKLSWERWFDTFKTATAGVVSALAPLENGESVLDKIDQDDFKRACENRINPYWWAREFATSFSKMQSEEGDSEV